MTGRYFEPCRLKVTLMKIDNQYIGIKFCENITELKVYSQINTEKWIGTSFVLNEFSTFSSLNLMILITLLC